MRTAQKIKGILGTAGVTYDEFAQLCGVTRKTIHQYLNTPVDIEDFENGLVAMDVADKLMKLCYTEALPIPKGVPKDEKMERLKELVI